MRARHTSSAWLQQVDHCLRCKGDGGNFAWRYRGGVVTGVACQVVLACVVQW